MGGGGEADRLARLQGQIAQIMVGVRFFGGIYGFREVADIGTLNVCLFRFSHR